MTIVLVVIAVVVGFGLGKLDAIRRFNRWMVSLSADQRRSIKELMH